MSIFIDVFYMPNEDPRMPYHGYIWQAGRLINTTRHRDVATLVTWCKQQDLPVRVHEPSLRTQLRNLGVNASGIVAVVK
jgi:hypothetical protein